MSPPADVSPLHVLTLTPFFPSQQNEVTGCFVSDAIEYFPQFGIDSTVIAALPIHYPRRHPIPSAPAEWVRYPQLPGTFGLSSAGKFLGARLFNRVRQLYAAKPNDLIHAHAALPCGHAAALLSRRLHIPFVVTVHGLDVFNSCVRGGIPAAWRREVCEQVYASARTVICISGRVQQILKAGTTPATRSTVVYNGVNPNFFSPKQDAAAQPDPEILAVGTLLPSKGHELVLRAIAQLKGSHPSLRCRIIGEGPDRARFESLARELELVQQVQFIGRQSRHEVADAMRQCSIFVLPSRNEALGCVYLEAMSCGKPVIACRGQGIDEIIEHGRNGWLIAPDGLAELVEGLSVLLNSADLRRRIGAAARQTILGKLTLTHQAQQLAAVYREAIATQSVTKLAPRSENS